MAGKLSKTKKRSSLFIKIGALASALVLVAASAAAWLSSARIERLFNIERERQIRMLASSSEIVIKNPLAGGWHDIVIDRMRKIVSGNTDIDDCVVVDREGTVVFDFEIEREGKKFVPLKPAPGKKFITKEIRDGNAYLGEIHMGYAEKGVLESQRRKEIINFALVMADNLADVLASYKFTGVKVIVDSMVKDVDNIEYCVVTHSSGRVLFNSRFDDLESAELDEAEDGPAANVNSRRPLAAQYIKNAETGDEILDVAALFEKDGRQLGVVRIGYSLKEMQAAVIQSKIKIFLVCVAFAAVSVMFSLILANRIAGPIVYLSKIAERIGGGELNENVIVRRSGDEIEQLGNSFNDMIKGLRERDLVKDMFSRYVTKQVAEELLNNPDMVALGGKKQEVTVLFADIRGFTSFSERREPEDVIAHLNEYLSAMVDVIFKHEGTLDKYIGDAIMAVFGSPLAHDDDALRAARTALEMQEKMSALNERWIAGGQEPFQIGIGINTGEAISGNIGDLRRMEYTVIGDNVNLASRIESLTKQYRLPIIISASTYNKVAGQVVAQKLEQASIRGKENPVDLYNLIGLRE